MIILQRCCVSDKENKIQISSTTKDLLDSIPSGIIIINTDKIIDYINTKVTELYGYSNKDLIGTSINNLFISESDTTNTDLKVGVDQTIVSIRKDKSQFATHLTISALKSSQTNQMIVSIDNIGKSIERENRYRILVETSKVPQFVMNQTTFIYANEAAAKLYGYDSVDDLKNLHPSEISPKFQPDGQDSETKSKEMVSLAYKNGSHRFDFMNIKKDGSEILMDIILTCMPHMGKDALFVACHDITERQKTEQILRQSQKMDALGQLTGGIAHDYNNMLGVILGYTELLKSSISDIPKLVKYLMQIQHAAERGAKLTKKLLSFSRVDHLQETKLHVNELLLKEKDMLQKVLTVQVKLTLELAENIWPVWLDNTELEDAILNITINAMHALENNKLERQLTIQTNNISLMTAESEQLGLAAGDYVLLSILDNGCGMEERIKEKIFDPFFSSKGKKGTGLGLSQVFSFVERSGGAVVVHSKPEVGSQFHLYLPRYFSVISEDQIVHSIKDMDLTGNESILVVDDETALRKLTVEILQEKGYKLYSVGEAKSALAILENKEIDMLLSDVIMPDMNGYRLAAIVQEKYPAMKIQLVSGYTDDHHKEFVDEIIYRNLIYKPYTFQHLLQQIRTLLNSK